MNSLNNERIHFIGVGGTSMSALASYSLHLGAKVSGSDRTDSDALDRLSKLGAEVYVGENAKFVEGVDVVVFSSAISPDNPELKRALELKKIVYERFEFLGEIAKTFDRVVAIAGTHGKTTVTAMLAHMLYKLNATFVGHVGGETEYGNLIINLSDGKSVFLTEACEYRQSLLSLKPYIGVVLNAECDHPDCYPDLQSVQNVFKKFLASSEIKIVNEDLSLICGNVHMFEDEYGNSDESKEKDNVEGRIEVFSNEEKDIFEYAHSGEVSAEICVYKNGEKLGIAVVPQRGKHNRLNALYAITVCMKLGYRFEDTVSALASFKGVLRRYEKTGSLNGAEVIFDYAHHPTQIKTVLDVAKESGRVLTVFQPHTYSRTAKFLDDFLDVLSACDGLIIMPTYAAREKNSAGVDSLELYAHILSKFPETNVYIAKNHMQTVDFAKWLSKEYDVVLCLGAGDIYALKSQIRDC